MGVSDLDESGITSEYIGKLISEWNEIDTGIHDIQIIKSNSGSDFANDVVKNLLKNIPDENPISIRNLNFVNDFLRSRAFKIILSNPDELV
jgi:hypothetical protein